MSKTMNATVPSAERVATLLDKARHYCAVEDRCESGVRQKLISWGAAFDEVEGIVASLRADGYIDDVRYACAYSRSKLVGQRWSRQKVLYQLRLKHLPKEVIEHGIASVDDDTYFDILRSEADKKLRQLGGGSDADTRHRLMAFLASRGYTMGEINTVLER